MTAFYDSKPSTLEALGNGCNIYRWNIQEEAHEAREMESAPTRQWRCQEVRVWSPLSANKITEACIGGLWDSNYEQKLVNEYNAAQLGMYDEAVAKAKIAAYKKFLTERNTIKAQVDTDCTILGIR